MNQEDRIKFYARNPNFGDEEEKLLDKVYMFVSVDIVGSTRFKANNQFWIGDYTQCLDTIFEKFWHMEGNILTFWKFNGDEILFYIEINKRNQITAILKDIYDQQKAVLDDEIFKRTKLSLKSTCWLAYFDESFDKSSEKKGHLSHAN